MQEFCGKRNVPAQPRQPATVCRQSHQLCANACRLPRILTLRSGTQELTRLKGDAAEAEAAQQAALAAHVQQDSVAAQAQQQWSQKLADSQAEAAELQQAILVSGPDWQRPCGIPCVQTSRSAAGHQGQLSGGHTQRWPAQQSARAFKPAAKLR